MTGMNQSALEGFVKIVELNSYSAAAEALYLSQSALSQQIRTLEGQLGFELFQHVPRKVLLTPAGQDFYPRAKQIMELYREAVRHGRAVKQQANPPARHLELGVCHAAVRMLPLPAICALPMRLSSRSAPPAASCGAA